MKKLRKTEWKYRESEDISKQENKKQKKKKYNKQEKENKQVTKKTIPENK